MPDDDHILIVDDERDIALLLKQYLSMYLPENFTIVTAHDFENGIQLLQNKKFVLSIFDFDLGNASGKDLLDFAKKNQKSKHVIMMSAYASNEEINQFYHIGASTFLQKPLSLDQLQKIITLIT